MLPRQQRLAPSVLIKDTIRRGRRSRNGALVVHLLLTTDQVAPGRAAFAVGRSVGNSVERHRVTRQLRAITTPLLHELPLGSQMVVRALPEARGASSGQLAADLRAALNKIPLSSAPMGGAGEAVESAGPRAGWRRVLWFIGWPIRALLLALIWIYRHTISPILPPTCRYHPSCSTYAFGALQRHGAAKGFALASWRLLRCNPFTPGGLDPVPPRGRWRPDIEPDGTPRVTPTQVA
ncbi:MAG: membrane protein insertion efficiency factor YidD [Candidatus Nanopelagicales bacterium]